MTTTTKAAAELAKARRYLSSVEAAMKAARVAGAWERADYLQNSIDDVREEIERLERVIDQAGGDLSAVPFGC